MYIQSIQGNQALAFGYIGQMSVRSAVKSAPTVLQDASASALKELGVTWYKNGNTTTVFSAPGKDFRQFALKGSNISTDNILQEVQRLGWGN